MATTFTQLSLSIILGTLPISVLPVLPTEQQMCLLAIAVVLLWLTPWQISRSLALCLMMFIWSATSAQQVLTSITALTRQPIVAEVKLGSFTKDNERMSVRLIRVNQRIIFPPLYVTLNNVRLDAELCAGQRWLMTLRLRPIHARLNEGEFDRQRFSLARNSPLTGRIVEAKQLSADCGWRQRIITKAQAQYQHRPWHSILTALAFGERSDVTTRQNQLLRETGTAHLMAISGMHIGLAAVLGWMAARGIQFFFPAVWLGYRFPFIVSLLAAAGYAWLAGNNPPSVRAMAALSIWGIIRLSGMNCNSWQVWSLCIGGILLFEPLTIISDSLWLSALAVASLLVWYQWFPLPKALAFKKRWFLLQLAHLQIGIMLLLMPIQVYLFHGVSLTALIANMFAIPVVTFITVPLILTAILLPVSPVGPLLWWLADRSIAVIFTGLQALPAGWIAINHDGAILSVFCWLLLAALRFSWWHSAPITLGSLVLVSFYWRYQLPKPDWRIDMLDVGHGLALVISRENKAILYDTGNRWPSGDIGERVIVPWLRWQGIEPQQVILSHDHLDHTGGLESIQRAYPRLRVRSALLRDEHLPCIEGEKWQWQGLQFRVLWPEALGVRRGNNDSCVVLIDDGKHRVLLTGDLEAAAELKLMAKYRSLLQADIIQVPHHGSRTSSSAPLLRAVKGKVALASVARFNAWKLPAKKIIHRYEENDYQWRDTALSGQLSVRFFNEKWQVMGMREQILPRWYHQWFGVPRESR
nr:ComEC family protein [Pantoea sp. 201603H]